MTVEEISEVLGCGTVRLVCRYFWSDRRCTVAFDTADGAYCTVPSIYPDPDWQIMAYTIDELKAWAQRVGWNKEVRG